MNANAARLRRTFLLGAAIALLLAAVATSFSLQSASAQGQPPEGTPAIGQTQPPADDPSLEGAAQSQRIRNPVAQQSEEPAESERRTPTGLSIERQTVDPKSDPQMAISWTAPARKEYVDTPLVYQLHGFKAEHREKDTTTWTSYGETLSKTDTSAVLSSGVKVGATYEARVMAVYKAATTEDTQEGPWTAAVSGQANRAPAASPTAYIPSESKSWRPGTHFTYQSLNLNFEDADGDTLTYSVSSDKPSIVAPSVVYKGETPAVSLEKRNPGSATITYAASDAYGGYFARTFTFTVTSGETRSIAENSPAGAAVGDPVAGTPYDDGDDQTDDSLTYSLTGEAATSGVFTIDSATGQIRVTASGCSALDFETKTSYDGEVGYTVNGNAVSVSVTINVTDVAAEKPCAPGTLTVVRTPSSEPMDPALSATWAAPADNGTAITEYRVRYRIKDAGNGQPGGWESVIATTTSAKLPNLDAGAVYEVRARAINANGTSPFSGFFTGTANTPPTASAVALDDATVAWKASAAYDLSDKFEDAEDDSLTYSATSEYPGVLTAAITGASSDTLTVTVVNPAAATVTYGASDPYGGYATRTVTITGQGSVTRYVVDGSSGGTAVGAPVTGTPYGGETLTYTLEFEGSQPFVIDSATGQISVKEGETLDRGTKSSYELEVHWTVQGQAASTSLTINVIERAAVVGAAPSVTRTEFTKKTDPALDVTWTAAEANGLTILSYEAQYRIKVAEGETKNTWTDYTGTLAATATTLNLADLTAGATYQVQVRAVTETGGEGKGPWSDTGEGTANTPPAVSTVALDDATVAWKTSADYGLSDKFEDADDDSLTYSATSEYPGVLTAAITGANSDTLTVTVVNPAAATVTYAASDPYGGYVTRTVTITGEGSVERSILEDSSSGTAVGSPVTGTPYDDGDDQTDDALSYTLYDGDSGDVEGSFAIASATGQISVETGATLDYDTKSSYTGEVEWTVQGRTASASLTINVIERAAVVGAAPSVTRTEFTEETAPALDVTWTAANANGLTITGYEAQYRKKPDTEWTLYQYDDPDNPGTEISLLSADTTSINLPGLEAGKAHEAQVRAVTEEKGEGPWSDTGEGTANNPPTPAAATIEDGSFPVETAQYAFPTMEMSFNEIDGDSLSHDVSVKHPYIADARIVNDPDYRSGRVLYFWFYNPAPTEITYGAHDGYGGYAEKTVVHTGTRSETLSVPEDSPAGTAVGDPITPPQAGRPEGETLTYTLTGDAAAAFVIDATTGQISVKTGATLDHDTKSSYTGKVEYTVEEQSAAVNLTINVLNSNVPTGSGPTSNGPTSNVKKKSPPRTPEAPSVAKSQTDPTDTLDVGWTKPSTADARPITDYDVRYRAEGADEWTQHPFTGTETNTAIEGVDSGIPYEVQVRAGNAAGSSDWSESGKGGIAVLASIQGPPGPVPEGSTVDLPVSLSSSMDVEVKVSWHTAAQSNPAPENGAGGDSGDDGQSPAHEHQPSSGTVTFQPGDAEESISITIADDEEQEDLESFRIELGEVTVSSPYLVEIEDSTATVSILDDDAPPVFTEGETAERSVAENTPSGQPIGAPITATDAEDDPLNYTLSGADASEFTLDRGTGQLRTSAPLDYESKRTYTALTVTVDDGHDHTDTISLTVNVTNVDASPKTDDEGDGPDPTPPFKPAPTVTPPPAATPAPTVPGPPPVTPGPTVLPAPALSPESESESTPGLSLVSNIRPPQRQLALREVGRGDVGLPVRAIGDAGEAMETPAEVGIPEAGSTSARVVPDGGPSLPLSDPGVWVPLSLALLSLPIFFLVRRRRKRKEAQGDYV